MGYPLQPAQVPGGGVFSVRDLVPYSTETFIRGAVVIYDASHAGFIAEAATGVKTVILGVALQGASTSPGNQMANSPTTITWKDTTVAVAIADAVSIFQSTFVNGSATRVAPAATDVGVAYGLSKYTDWAVDKSLTTTNAAVTVVAVDTMRNIVLFKFLPACIVNA